MAEGCHIKNRFWP